jgi:hypothetical protein
MVPAQEGIAFPIGTMDTFSTYAAPADRIEFVNTVGLPMYAEQQMDRWGKGIDIKTEGNILPIVKRPRLCVRVHTSN